MPPKKRKRRTKKAKTIKMPWWFVAAICAVLAGFILYPFIDGGHVPEEGAKLPSHFHGELGIDISHNNRGTIVWDSLMVLTDRSGHTIRDIKAAKTVTPVSFIFIKATEGQSMVDSRFSSNWKNAAKHGITRGAYHFYRTSKDPARQARHFIRTVGKLRHGDLPPVLDIETMHHGYTKEQLDKDLHIWLKIVEDNYGRKPIIYTYESFAKTNLSKEITDSYPIWIAHYKTERPDRSDWQYWQFTDRALVYGIEYPVDMSIAR